jgi:hypothetical protein
MDFCFINFVSSSFFYERNEDNYSAKSICVGRKIYLKILSGSIHL